MITLACIQEKRYHQGFVLWMVSNRRGRGDNVSLFTPPKEIVYGYKAYAKDERFVGKYPPVSDKAYTEVYLNQLEQHKEQIAQWLNTWKTSEVTLCCYCRSGTFCHRYLLFSWLKRTFPDLLVQCF